MFLEFSVLVLVFGVVLGVKEKDWIRNNVSFMGLVLMISYGNGNC